MTASTDSTPHDDDEGLWPITRIAVSGFKSIAAEQAVEIRPLTILAGANSSGKSSIIQPLLLLKQTLQASTDPGPLLLYGPNAKFRSSREFLHRSTRKGPAAPLHIQVQLGGFMDADLLFEDKRQAGLELRQTIFKDPAHPPLVLQPNMTQGRIKSSLPIQWASLPDDIGKRRNLQLEWVVVRNRCFYELVMLPKNGRPATLVPAGSVPGPRPVAFINSLRQIIHLPGLRGNPERSYSARAIDAAFPGTFEDYTASVIASWQATKQAPILRALFRDLRKLRLTSKIVARQLNESEIEIRVARLLRPLRGDVRPFVNIADVGVGVSQVLPILVALHAALPGQLVYIEQPETHLHPLAQHALAEVLVSAAKRNVQVVVETHSSGLLLGIQTMVAEGKISHEYIKLHWFQRSRDGRTAVETGELDDAGRFGNWPEDFDDVALGTQKAYLDAADKRLFENEQKKN